MEYKEVKANPEEVEEGTFNFAVALSSHLDNDENKYSVEEALGELDEALCWRNEIEGDEYPYDHLQTDYQPLPLQKVELEVPCKNAIVITLTYAPYEDCEFAKYYGVDKEHELSTRHWDITEYKKAGETQHEMRVVQKLYKLFWHEDD